MSKGPSYKGLLEEEKKISNGLRVRITEFNQELDEMKRTHHSQIKACEKIQEEKDRLQVMYNEEIKRKNILADSIDKTNQELIENLTKTVIKKEGIIEYLESGDKKQLQLMIEAKKGLRQALDWIKQENTKKIE